MYKSGPFYRYTEASMNGEKYLFVEPLYAAYHKVRLEREKENNGELFRVA